MGDTHNRKDDIMKPSREIIVHYCGIEYASNYFCRSKEQDFKCLTVLCIVERGFQRRKSYVDCALGSIHA